MISLMAQKRWLFVAAVGVLITAFLVAWLLVQAGALLVAPVGAVAVLALGGAIIGLTRAAAARRALSSAHAADISVLREEAASTLRSLARVENRLLLAERRIARLVIKLSLTENENL